jgi:hypothetical protein
MFFDFFSVAIRLDKSEVVDWLVKEIQEKQIQLDIRVKKYVKYSYFFDVNFNNFIDRYLDKSYLIHFDIYKM